MVGENRSVLMRCGRCSRQVPMGELKYDKDGKTLLCITCRGTRPEATHADESTVVQSATEVRKHYFCSSCGYHFTRANIVPVNCPYCGKQGTVVSDKSVASGRLLDDA